MSNRRKRPCEEDPNILWKSDEVFHDKITKVDHDVHCCPHATYAGVDTIQQCEVTSSRCIEALKGKKVRWSEKKEEIVLTS